MKLISMSIVIVLLGGMMFTACAADIYPRKPGPSDKCPVCGMFVTKFPDFSAQFQFKDGSVLHFDGAKDLFKYMQATSRYTPGKSSMNISAVFVNSYYGLKPINGLTAWYVAGSDVYGPMGKELVPFARESEAQEFKKDHKGKVILRFKEITPAVIKELD